MTEIVCFFPRTTIIFRCLSTSSVLRSALSKASAMPSRRFSPGTILDRSSPASSTSVEERSCSRSEMACGTADISILFLLGAASLTLGLFLPHPKIISIYIVPV